MRNRNIATGNARVGVQAGQIHGDVMVGAVPRRPADLGAELAEFRGLLKRAHADGQLDEQSYAAAESELDAATDCLRNDSSRRRGTLLVALKRLRGLVSDVTGLAARLAAVIAAAEGLS